MTSKLDKYRTSVFGNDPNIISNNEARDANLKEYLRNQSITRASLSRRDLTQHTDVKFFVSSNIANLISFISVLAVTFCLGWMGWGRDIRGTYRNISGQFETLLTPVFWIIPISWAVIFFAEAVYLLSSCRKIFSHLSIVQNGIGFHFFYVNCCQLGWIVSYCMDLVWLATIWMGINVVFLVWLNFNLYYQDYISRAPKSRLEMSDDTLASMSVIYEWVLFRLPFQLHLGWGLYLLLLHFNETFLELGWSGSSNFALVSIIVLWIIGIFVLFYPKSPIFAIPLMITWVTAGVWINLRDPSDFLLKTYGPETTQKMYGGIIATCIEHGLISFIRFIIFFASSYSLLEKE